MATRIVGERCFVGPVSREENRAAHGNITLLEERDDGARRSVNVNGIHVEVGTWGPTREQREALAARALKEARDLVAEIPQVSMVHSDGREISVWVDADGFLVADGALHTREEALSVIRSIPGLLELAKQARRAVLLANQLSSEV